MLINLAFKSFYPVVVSMCETDEQRDRGGCRLCRS